MPAIQNLKKQLRGIKSTQKLTKAMRTVSTVKFSKLNGVYSKYSAFGRECADMYEKYKNALAGALPKGNPEAPVLVIVIASNKGLCGSFNSELLNFAKEELEKADFPYTVIPCGKKAVSWFAEKRIEVGGEYVLSDVPSYEDSGVILDDIIRRISAGEISSVRVIYPKYTNMMKQTPVCTELFCTDDADTEERIMYVPDEKTVISGTAIMIFRSLLYEILLETAIGAQAATLMTMRSAYDTATEYAAQLEGQINRLRQSAVTSDVIETSSVCEE